MRTPSSIGQGLLLAAVAAVLPGCAQTAHRAAGPSPARSAGRIVAGRLDPSVRRSFLLGRSVRRRPIVVVERGDRDARARMLVVGAIHGNEGAGIAIARRLGAGAGARESQLWLLDDLNPDGVVATTRQNARGVDLNRNFPFRWRPLGRLGDQQYSGPRALSEPESRIARGLILRLRPAITIWFHQAQDLVDRSGGDVAVERRFARLTGLRLRRLTRFPGSVVGWENHGLPGTTAFVVELPPGRLSAPAVRRYARAVLALDRGLGRARD